VSSPPTGEVTFFFTDIQGSTAMWERDAKRMQLALIRHDEILKAVVEEHGGYVFKMVGDACCAAFASVPDALKAGVRERRRRACTGRSTHCVNPSVLPCFRATVLVTSASWVQRVPSSAKRYGRRRGTKVDP